MIILGHTLNGIAQVLAVVLNIVFWLVAIRVLISWVNPDPFNPVVRFLTDSTDPLLRPIRRYVRPVGPGIDLSPIILFLVIVFLQNALVPILVQYAHELVMQ